MLMFWLTLWRTTMTWTEGVCLWVVLLPTIIGPKWIELFSRPHPLQYVPIPGEPL